jgi:TolB protein
MKKHAYKVIQFIAFILLFFPENGFSKIYIDITSPTFRQIPVALDVSGDPAGEKIKEIIQKDLEFTGLVMAVDSQASGTEYILTGNVESSDKVYVDFSITEVAESKKILEKRYKAGSRIIRALAHSIANDAFEALTGQPGMFRTKIACVEVGKGVRELTVMDWDGYDAVTLLTTKNLLISPRWSADGQYLGYTAERKKAWGFYRINLQTGKEMAIYTTNKGLNLLGGFSKDGWIYYASSETGDSEIYKIHIQGNSKKRLTNSVAIDVSPSVSNDGRRVAYVSDRSGNPQIYIMDSNGNNSRRVTSNGSYNTSPVWSPDGKKLAYVGRTGSGNQIFLLDFETQQVQQLTSDGNNEAPSFCPNSLFLTFESDRTGQKGIYIMRVDGNNQTQITPAGQSNITPSWSPVF